MWDKAEQKLNVFVFLQNIFFLSLPHDDYPFSFIYHACCKLLCSAGCLPAGEDVDEVLLVVLNVVTMNRITSC